MLAFTIRRLLAAIPVLIISSMVVFVLVSYGQDPMANFRHKNPPPSQASIDFKAHQLGLDHSLPYRWWHWITQITLHFNFGANISGHSVRDNLFNAAGVTFKLVLAAILIALILGVAVGVLSAVRQYSKFDYSTTMLGFLFFSLPVFWFAVLLKQVAVDFNLGTNTHFFNTIGDSTSGLTGGLWAHVYDTAGHLILPTITLALVSFASWARFQRASMLDVLNSDYMRLARAKGLSPSRVMIRHGMRTALIPLTTQVALDVPALLSGVVVTETIFNWSGLGTMLIQGINNVDANSILGWMLFSAVLIILFNLLADLLYAVLDPRIRLV